MPIIYLSPSTQKDSLYVSGDIGEGWMNRLADAMEPYLTTSGTRYSRNIPDMTAASSIHASNVGDYDLHLALHSNAAPEGQYDQTRGILMFYHPGSVQEQRAATLVVDGLKIPYPLSNRVRTELITSVGEVRRVHAPSVFLELGHHDNADDVAWIKNNLEAAVHNIVPSLTEYLGMPFLEFRPSRPVVVDASWGCLNIRNKPDTSSPVLVRVYDGARLTVLNQWQNWYVVRSDNMAGWANADFITSF